MPPDPSNQPLNEHVLEEIFSIVYDTSYSTVQSLLLTNHQFHALTRPLLYRYIGLNLATDCFMSEIQSWLVKPEKFAIPKAIRHIRLFATYYYDPKEDAKDPNDYSMKIIGEPRDRLGDLGTIRRGREPRDEASEWSTIARLISQTTQLRSLTFSHHKAMPLVLLQAIHNYPIVVHLNMSHWTRLSSDTSYNDPAELALLGSPSLRSLQAIIGNPECNAEDLRMPAFWRLVRSAPNLHSLALMVVYGGCVINSDTPEEIQEWKALASEFERTTLSRNLPSGLRNLKIKGQNLSGFKDGELSCVTTLDCSQDLDLEIIPSLTSLTRLTLRGNIYHTGNPRAIDDSFITCSPLTSLRIVSWRKSIQLDTILTHHGSSLRALAVHEFERCDSKPRDVLLIDEILRIRDGCPHLEEFSIDLNIPENPILETDHLTTDIHQEVYDALSTFPSLRKLQLNFNLGISSYNLQRCRPAGLPQSVPLADETFVQKVWKAVNVGRAAPLAIQELRIAQGEAGRGTGRGYPAGWVLWEQRQHHWLKATQSERDDEPDRIVISKHKDTPDFADDLWRECRW